MSQAVRKVERLSGSGLVDEIAAMYGGYGNGEALVLAFRRSVVLVPRRGEEAVLTGDHGGVRWALAFTDEAELARFAAARKQDDRAVDYLSTRGSRLLDVVVPELGVPGGVALDVAGKRPMFLPLVVGIVPDTVAVG
ncbi:MAG: SseB family protein [Sciscionella sp.]